MKQDIRKYTLINIQRIGLLCNLGLIHDSVADRLIKKELDILESLLK